MCDLSKAVVLVLGVSSVLPGAVRGQGQDPDVSIKFNLSTPGARSLAMGGAFLALADDATAAYTNPAGLTNLTLGGSEVALEVRHWQLVNSFVDRGHGLGEATGFGVDTVDGLQRDEAESDVTGMSFISFAYVLPRGLTLAVYRHELANFESAFDTQGPFLLAFPDDVRFLPQRSRTKMEIVNYGISGGIELELPALWGVESSLSIGLGVSYYHLDLNAVNEFYDFEFEDDETIDRLPRFFYGPPDFTDDNLLQSTTQIGDDDTFGFNVGWLWKLGVNRRWSLGGVFRQGPDFETSFEGFECVDERIPGPRTFFPDPDPSCFFAELLPGTIHVPDVFGLGVAYRSAGGTTKIALDVNRVRYSQQTEDFVAEGSDLVIDDADQVHLGFERIVLVVESLFVGTVRFGFWNEPFHELEFAGDPDDPDPSNQLLNEFFDRPQDDEIHLSLGVGLVIKEDYQIDAAADFSDRGNTFSFSLVKFF